MECHTCQNLYHQECHKPAISNQEADDPRLVWNCSNCSGPKVPKVAHSSSKIPTSKVELIYSYILTISYSYIKKMHQSSLIITIIIFVQRHRKFPPCNH